MKTNPPRAERLRAPFVVEPAVDVLAVVVDADWLVLLEVDVVDRLVMVSLVGVRLVDEPVVELQTFQLRNRCRRINRHQQ